MAGKNRAEALKQDAYLWLQTFTFLVVALVLVFTFAGRIIGVDGASMVPTLHDKDTLLLQSIGYTARQGDVVVLTKYFDNVRGPVVKRVIATGGQTVDIDYETGTVAVDGVALDETYIKEPMQEPRFGGTESITHVVVPEGHIFVMGDNRNNSNDSRNPALGVVDNRYVLGRAFVVLLPFRDFKLI